MRNFLLEFIVAHQTPSCTSNAPSVKPYPQVDYPTAFGRMSGFFGRLLLLSCSVEEKGDRDVVQMTIVMTSTGSKLPILPFASHPFLSIKRKCSMRQPFPNKTMLMVLFQDVSEASFTVPRVRYVMDCGFLKSKVHNTSTVLPMCLSCSKKKSNFEQSEGAGKCVALRFGQRLQSGQRYHQCDSV